jgi:putative SOS response-associated peptidase YedK
MCGRYASGRSTVDLAETFHIAADHADEVTRQDFNVAPSKRAPIVLSALPPDADKNAHPVRQLRLAKFGLTPAWMKDAKKGRPLIDARAETIDDKPTFRRPFAQRRCLVPADGFFEWFESTTPDGKTYKQPYFFRPADGSVLAMAGIVEWWHDPDADEKLWTPTYSIITTQATDDAGMVHDRMPMIVTADRWDAWLDPQLTQPEGIRQLMGPPAPGSLQIYPVSTAVNLSRNNGPQLIEPITLAA